MSRHELIRFIEFLVVGLILIVPAPSFSGGIYFYDDDKVVVALSDLNKEKDYSINLTKDSYNKNNNCIDEIHFVNVKKGTKIKIYNGKSDDINSRKKYDWAEIEIRRSNNLIVISNLRKKSNSNDYVIYFNKGKLDKKKKNNLENSISYITVYPACKMLFSVNGPDEHNEYFECDGDPGCKIYKDANRIIENINNNGFTAYSHTTNVDDATGRYYVDCSGLLYYILKYSIPLTDHYEAMLKVKSENHKRPLAGDVYNFLTSADHPGWVTVDRLDDAQPGDIIVNKYGADSRSRSTGHVVIVAGAAEQVGNIEYNNKKYELYKMQVIDSGQRGHGSDIRDAADYIAYPPIGYVQGISYGKVKNSGVGRGYIYFGVDENNRISFYRWKSKLSKTTAGCFVIGRAVNFDK